MRGWSTGNPANRFPSPGAFRATLSRGRGFAARTNLVLTLGHYCREMHLGSHASPKKSVAPALEARKAGRSSVPVSERAIGCADRWVFVMHFEPKPLIVG